MSHSPLLFYFNSKHSKQLLDNCFSLTFFKTFHRTIDLNECDLELHNCDSNAECVDREGSYDCKCKNGFIGDGVFCTGEEVFCSVS